MDKISYEAKIDEITSKLEQIVSALPARGSKATQPQVTSSFDTVSRLKSEIDHLLGETKEGFAAGDAVLQETKSKLAALKAPHGAVAHGAVVSRVVVPSRVAKPRTMTKEEFLHLKSNKDTNFFITAEGTHKGKLNRLELSKIMGAQYTVLDFAQVKDITSEQVYNYVITGTVDGASNILVAVADVILMHHPELKKRDGASVVASGEGAPGEGAPSIVQGANVEDLGGGGGLKDYIDLVKKISIINETIDSKYIDYEDILNKTANPEEKKNFYKKPEIVKLVADKKKIQDEQKVYMSTRPTRSTKINTTAEMITEAVKEIERNSTYRIPDGFPNSGTDVTSLRDLRSYILEYIRNDAVFLTLMTTDIGLNLNTVLPEYNPVVVEEQLQSKLVNGILVLIDENNNKYDMPNFAGDPQNRKRFSKLYDKDTCFGFGPLKRNPQCTALLLDCINGDTTRCRELLAEDKFKEMIEADMTKTNVFMIAKLLDNIGYPRVENGIKFDPDMNNWYSKIQAYFSLDDTVSQKQTLNDIKQNNNLKLALEHMVRKYNKYAKLINTNNLKITSLPAVYGKGGDASSALLAYDGYNTTGGSVTVLDGKHRNINAIYEMAKELKDKYDLTKEYTKLFTNLHTNIKNKNVVIHDNTVIEFRKTLEDFKTTELKLNKLLVLFTNFAFLLNKDEQDNTESNQILLTLINKENMEKYITARNKIMTSLDKRRNKMTMMVGPYGPQIFSQY